LADGRGATSTDAISAAFARAEKKIIMDTTTQIQDVFPHRILPAPYSSVHLADERVARLLLVLHDIDQSLAGLEKLPLPELTELASGAILACGFVDGTETRYAIAAVLEAIEGCGPMPENS
jgi:hypothetical protein